MKKKILFFALMCLILCHAHSQTIWHQPAVKENSQIEGYFSSLLNITRVEFDKHETRVYMHVSLRPELWIRFSKDTYLNAEGKSYAVKGCDGLELGKETFLAPDGNADLVFHFEPLPKNIREFDFIEGHETDAFKLLGITTIETQAKQLFPSNWRNVETGTWDISFYDKFAIYDCRFWNYKQKKQHNDQYEFLLENEGKEIKVKVEKCKKTHRQITVDGQKAEYEIINSITLPDYPKPDTRTGFKDNGYQTNDTIHLIGWLRGMPENMKKQSDEYTVNYTNILIDQQVGVTAKLDSLGRFHAKIPALNSVEVFNDWGRTFVRTTLEAGKTYFLLYDMKGGHKIFMGKDARLQNELLAYPIPWSNFHPERQEMGKITADEILERYKSHQEKYLKEHNRLVEAHPLLSTRYKIYSIQHYNCGLASSLMQAKFYVKDRFIPKHYLDYVEQLRDALPKPYTLIRDYSHMLRDYMDEHASKRKINADMDASLIRLNMMTETANELGMEQSLKDILATSEIIQWLEYTAQPMNSHLITFAKEHIKMEAAQAALKHENEKYLALEKKELRYETSLHSNDVVAGIDEGENILRKLLAPLKGKIVLIDIWGTWCSPCKEALSHSQEEYERLNKYPIVYLYLANRSNDKTWKNVIKQYNVTGENVHHYNLPAPQQQKIESFLQVHSFPTYKIVDKQGNILDIKVDARSLDTLEKIVKKLSEE